MPVAASRVLDAFDAVAACLRQRSRARTPYGWVRIARLDPTHILLRGPHRSLYAIWSARKRDWRCLRSEAGSPPLHYRGCTGSAELLIAPRA